MQFPSFSLGLLRSYTSPALLSIQHDNNNDVILSSSTLGKKDLISWIASTPPLASFLGTILSGPCLELFGRRKTLILLTVPCTLGWLLVGNAATMWVLLLGRALTGLASGLATATTPLYIVELCASPEIRGCLGLFPGIMLATGVFLGFVLAHQFQNWRTLALVISLFPLTLAGLSLTIQESASWLLRKNEKDEKKENKNKFDLQMEQVVPAKKSKLSEKTELISKKSHDLATFSRQYLFPASIPVILMVFQQLSGGNAVIYYLSEILTKNHPGQGPSRKSAEVSPLSNQVHQSSLIIGLVQFLGFFLALPLIDRVGRRKLLIASALLMSVSHFLLGFHFHHLQREQVSSFEGIGAVPSYVNVDDYFNDYLVLRVSALCLLLSCYSIGLGPIPFLLVELFPADHVSPARSYLSSISSLANHLALFVVVKAFPYSFIEMPDVTFWGFGTVCWLAALFTFCFVP